MAKYHSVETREYRLERMAEWVALVAEPFGKGDDESIRGTAQRLTKWLNEKPKLNTL